MTTIRKAELRDVPALDLLIRRYVAEGVVLPRPLHDLYENVWEFTVAEENGSVAGCGALKLYNQELAEIRSVCVAEEAKAHGIGRGLTESLLAEAERLGLKTVFVLTAAPGFFEKCGFREVPREIFPTKIWRDCLMCPKYNECDEKTLSVDLPRTGRGLSRAASGVPATSSETTEVPA